MLRPQAAELMNDLYFSIQFSLSFRLTYDFHHHNVSSNVGTASSHKKNWKRHLMFNEPTRCDDKSLDHHVGPKKHYFDASLKSKSLSNGHQLKLA